MERDNLEILNFYAPSDFLRLCVRQGNNGGKQGSPTSFDLV